MLNVDVRLIGPLFTKNITQAVREAVNREVIDEVEKRMERSNRATRSKGRVLRIQPRNVYGIARKEMSAEFTSSLRAGRTKGTTWQKHNLNVIKLVVWNKARKAAQRAAGLLGGA